ncbi:MAG TPA: 4'-phosphopantetheinyl transferase superfamily protein [Methylomirabilota bacterium]|nr:4'-phosphopantetheinyl transferase superfamily protein [Methylomirabilota bacterium]
MLERAGDAARPAPPADDEAWVWLAPLDVEAAALDGLVAALSPEERARAARFHFRRDAMRWMVARGTLRAILGAYLDTDPAAIAFTYGPRGKPALAAEGVRTPPQFSVSHAADLAAVAVAAQAPVGVDVEQVRPLHDLEQIAARTFSARECRALRDLPPAQRAAGFFNCWTRKEAYIKGLGEGLSYPLDRFSVSLAPGLPARLEAVDDAPGEVDAWTMAALPVPAGFAGAVVVRRPGARVRCERWESAR